VLERLSDLFTSDLQSNSPLDYLRDILDILIVSFLVYRALLVIKGTRAAPMLIGLTLIVGIYFIATEVGLVTVAWILENFLTYLIIVIVVVFQDEIRRALTKVGLKPFYRKGDLSATNRLVEDLSLVCEKLSSERIGALIVIKKEVGLDELIEESVLVDAYFNRKLLYSIFVKESALHDGAVIIERERIKAAACLLPLSSDPDLDPNLGTRHRAAIGLSERSDAVIIVVSEETGSLSIVSEGKIQKNLSGAQLTEQLRRLLPGGAI
jgi:uncharacterized protein (TIGR00159 family)